MKKKQEKIKHINQTSFYFEDYLETNKKNRLSNKADNFQDRIYLLFFFFLSLILIFSIKITHLSLGKTPTFYKGALSSKYTPARRDIVDRNGILISRNVNSNHVAVIPKLVKNKKKFYYKFKIKISRSTN